MCSERVETVVHGATIRYIELTARCPFCGDEVYAPLINDTNVEARLNAYRREKGETQIIKCSPEEFGLNEHERRI